MSESPTPHPVHPTAVAGWGRFPTCEAYVRRETTVEGLQSLLSSARGPFVPRGLGRSYGDSSLLEQGTILDQTGRNRFLSFDPSTGLIGCEAGVTLGEIIEVFLPRGWFLPTTPGTKFVTVGGAIAADVHGKNHHIDGSFGRWVRHIRLLLPSGEILECGPDRNPEIFWATVGGMGLTGIILDAHFQLHPTASAYCAVRTHRTRDLDETLTYFEAHDRGYRYSVAWIDCLARGPRLGRSVIMLGNDAAPQDLPAALRAQPLRIPGKASVRVPFTPPISLIGRASVSAFNGVYYATHGDGTGFVDYDSYFYPLDRVLDWNRIYGPRGFLQYQALFPAATARDGLRDMLEHVSKAGAASFLAVLKRSGEQGNGLLSFLHPGFTLALDIPHPGANLESLSRALDEIVIRHGGRVYLAKDAVTSAEAFQAMYPRLGAFRDVKSRLDPGSMLQSQQALRLGILGTPHSMTTAHRQV